MKKPGETGDDLGRVALDSSSTFSSHALGEITTGGAAKRDFLFTVNGANGATLMLQVRRLLQRRVNTVATHHYPTTPPHHRTTPSARQHRRPKSSSGLSRSTWRARTGDGSS